MDISTTTTTPESLEQQTIQSTSRGNKRNKVSKACNECRKKKVNNYYILYHALYKKNPFYGPLFWDYF